MLDISKMKDIYDIKDIVLGLPLDMVNSLVFIMFITILAILYKYLYGKKKILNKNQFKTELKIKEEIDFKKIITDFENKYKNEQEKIFYSKLLSILRDLLEYSGNKNISKMTFKEMNKLKIDKSLIDLIKSIYYKEYKKKIEDSSKIRLDLIENIKKLIK